ncbi:unnamed protein product, partial [marine sediment metagenome]
MILLKSCFYIASNQFKEAQRGFDILIEGNRIKKVAENIEEKADTIIDCSHFV